MQEKIKQVGVVPVVVIAVVLAIVLVAVYSLKTPKEEETVGVSADLKTAFAKYQEYAEMASRGEQPSQEQVAEFTELLKNPANLTIGDVLSINESFRVVSEQVKALDERVKALEPVATTTEEIIAE